MNIKTWYFRLIVEQAQLFNPLISQIFDFLQNLVYLQAGCLEKFTLNCSLKASQSTKCEQRCFRRICFQKGISLKTDQNIVDTYFLISKRVQEAKISIFAKSSVFASELLGEVYIELFNESITKQNV